MINQTLKGARLDLRTSSTSFSLSLTRWRSDSIYANSTTIRDMCSVILLFRADASVYLSLSSYRSRLWS